MMNRKINLLALATAILLLSYAPLAVAEERARADIKNEEGKSVGKLLPWTD